MSPNREYLRTPVDAATAAQRFGHDFRLAARLKAKGVNPYKKGRAAVVLVDLASKGSIIEPRGLPLIHSKLFNTQTAVFAYELKEDIEAFERANRPQNVVHITLRPPHNLTAGGRGLLDKNGRCPIAELRAGQTSFNNLVQRAIAELDRKSLLTPLLVARHVLPHEGGSVMDLHAHLVATLEPVSAVAVGEYLAKIFGVERVWISSIAFPNEQRSFVATANYPVWRLANQDWNEVDDDRLVEFFEQSRGLRSVEVLGPLREFRQARRPEGDAADHGDAGQSRDDLDWDQSWDIVPEEVGTVDPDGSSIQAIDLCSHCEDDAIQNERDTIAAAAATLLAPSSMSQPVVHGCHFAWLGLTKRYVAAVSNYTTFSELQKYYDLDAYITFAEAHVAETHKYLFKPAIPETTSSSSRNHQSPVTVQEEGPETRLTPSPTTPETPEVEDKAAQPVNGNREQCNVVSEVVGQQSDIERPASMRAGQPSEPITPKSYNIGAGTAQYGDKNPDNVAPEPAVTIAPTMLGDVDPAGRAYDSGDAKRSSISKSSASEIGSGFPVTSAPNHNFTFQLAVRSSGEATATLTFGVPAVVFDAIGHETAARQMSSSRSTTL